MEKRNKIRKQMGLSGQGFDNDFILGNSLRMVHLCCAFGKDFWMDES